MTSEVYEKLLDEQQRLIAKFENQIKTISDTWHDLAEATDKLNKQYQFDGHELSPFAFTHLAYLVMCAKVEFARVSKFKPDDLNRVPRSPFDVNSVHKIQYAMSQVGGFPDIADGFAKALPLSKRFIEWRRQFEKELPSG
jgi:hypothetical protein